MILRVPTDCTTPSGRNVAATAMGTQLICYRYTPSCRRSLSRSTSPSLKSPDEGRASARGFTFLWALGSLTRLTILGGMGFLVSLDEAGGIGYNGRCPCSPDEPDEDDRKSFLCPTLNYPTPCCSKSRRPVCPAAPWTSSCSKRSAKSSLATSGGKSSSV